MGPCFQQLLPQLLTAKASRAFSWISIPTVYQQDGLIFNFQSTPKALLHHTPHVYIYIYTPFQYELAGVTALEGAAVEDPHDL